MKPRAKPPQKVPATESSEWQAATNDKCARAIAAWLKGSINTARPINTLKLEELKAMAENILSTFIVEVSHRKAADISEEERQRIGAILS